MANKFGIDCVDVQQLWHRSGPRGRGCRSSCPCLRLLFVASEVSQRNFGGVSRDAAMAVLHRIYRRIESF